MTEWQLLRISAGKVDTMLIFLILDAQVVYWREILARLSIVSIPVFKA